MTDRDDWDEDDGYESRGSPPRKDNTALIVVLVVVGVLGLVVVGGVVLALIGPQVWRAAHSSDVEAARAQMGNLELAIDLYRLSMKRTPPDLEALTKPGPRGTPPPLAAVPRDPWGGEYVLELLDRHRYRLRCLGEDGMAGTADDILWPPDDG